MKPRWPVDHGALYWDDKRERNEAFCEAMLAAGYQPRIITRPGTIAPKSMRGETIVYRDGQLGDHLLEGYEAEKAKMRRKKKREENESRCDQQFERLRAKRAKNSSPITSGGDGQRHDECASQHTGYETTAAGLYSTAEERL